MAEEIIQGILPVEIPNVDEIDIKYEDMEFLNNGSSNIEDDPGPHLSTQMTSSNINSTDHPMDTVEQLNTCEIKSESDQETVTKRTHAGRRNRKNCTDPIMTETHSNYICGKCDQSFDAHFKLIHHVQTYLKFCESCKLCFANTHDLIDHKKTRPIKKPSRKNKSRKRVQESKAPQNNGLPSSTKTCTKSSAPEESQHHNANIDKVICTSQNQDTGTVIGEANQTSKTGSELLVHSMTHTASRLPKTERPRIRQNKISTRPPHNTRSGKYDVGKSKLIAHGGDESTHQGDKNLSGEASDLTFASNNELILHKKSHKGRKHPNKINSKTTVDFTKDDLTTQTRDKSFGSETCKETSYTEESLSPPLNVQDARNTSRTCDDASKTAITESELTVNELVHSIPTLPKMQKRIVIPLRRITASEIEILTKNSKADTRLTSYTRNTSGRDDHDKSKLIQQDRVDTGEKTCSSEICIETSGKKYEFRKRKDTHTGESYSNHRKNSNTPHKKIYSGEKTYGSQSRGRKLKSKSVSQTHMKIIEGGRKGLRNHSVGKQYKCDICGKEFRDKYNFVVHMRSHTGEKPFKCNKCPKSFIRKYDLKVHEPIHTVEKPFKCVICHKEFASKANMERHESIHTGDKPFKCDVCHKSFGMKFHLKQHKRIHTGEKPYMCDVCGKSFTRCDGLSIHKKRHSGQKPHNCCDCEKSFTTLGELTVHKRIHTGQKRFSCGDCDKSFTSSQNLTVHERTHTGEKPFDCDVCNKSFASRSYLSVHKTLHTEGDSRPFKCDVCNTGCTTKTKLNIHMRRHTGEKPFRCNECAKCFSEKGGLNVHRRRHHTLKK